MLAVLGCGLILLEGVGRLFVYHVFHRGRLFQNDPVLGWRPLPNLERTRKNADGFFWTIRTNSLGYRSPRSWKAGAARRILVLGDSFAFGDGLNIEDRFDTLMSQRRPSWSIVNLGVMGYSTGQELIAGRDYYGHLGPGDAVILLTCANDFHDLLRRFFAGRAKPWFSREEGTLLEHPPDMTLLVRLRDSSYLAGRLMALLNIHQGRPISPKEAKQGMELYQALVREELGSLPAAGVTVILGYHDMTGVPEGTDVDAFFGRFSDLKGFRTVNLEERITGSDGLLKDRHWNRTGSAVVASSLIEQIDRLPVSSASEGRGPHPDAGPR